jgi:hypothetical protein
LVLEVCDLFVKECDGVFFIIDLSANAIDVIAYPTEFIDGIGIGSVKWSFCLQNFLGRWTRKLEGVEPCIGLAI